MTDEMVQIMEKQLRARQEQAKQLKRLAIALGIGAGAMAVQAVITVARLFIG